jgi:acetylornithine deacetylase/succinyl-diaminopimelate desuccinylase-like protein
MAAAAKGDAAAAERLSQTATYNALMRTTCVATRLEGGHADNALPQMARAGVNCRIMPGVQPSAVEAELKSIFGPGVEVTANDTYQGRPTPVSPLRKDVTDAYAKAVIASHGSAIEVVPFMSAGATDGSFFRERGTPVYGMDGSWVISPEDERAHGLDERMPVRAVYDNVLFWESVLKQLAGK